MSEQSTGLIVTEGVGLEPAEVIRIATQQANALMDIVESQELYATIEGKKYLEAEAWETIGAFNNVSAHTDWTNPIERDGEIVAYEAKVSLWKRGQEVGSAIMSCGLEEFPCRGKEGEAKHKAAKSAAQTWATSKAYRMNFSWVAVLAGYQATPADEMPDPVRTTKGGKQETKEHWCYEHNCAFDKKTKGGKTWYAHKPADGPWCNEVKKKPVEEPTADAEPVEQSEGIDMDWLKESLEILRAKNLLAWTESNLLEYMKSAYKVEADSVLDAAAKLGTGEAAHFVNRVEETLDMA